MKRKLWLIIKFYYYKWIRRMDIIGFYSGVPVIRDKNLEIDNDHIYG